MRRLGDVAWETWVPRDVAVLLFVVRGDEVLLIHKKRGLGAGKINGPGGRLDPGETPEQAARRELHEEVGLEAGAVSARGELRFQFVDGYSMHVHLFCARSADVRGEPIETDEAIPMWVPTTALPFDRMWAVDRLWLPAVLEGQRAFGDFLFEGDAMLDHRLELRGAPDAARGAAQP